MHHEDFVKCDDVIATDRVKECMKSQWSNRVVPGQQLKVKLRNEICSEPLIDDAMMM